MKLFVLTSTAMAQQWEHAGLLPETPTAADAILYINHYSGTDDEKIQAALVDARANSAGGLTTIIYFPQGTYDLYQTIHLSFPDRNILFQGAGYNQTNLRFMFADPDAICFSIRGNESATPLATLNDDWQENTATISSNDFSALQLGDWIKSFPETRLYALQ